MTYRLVILDNKPPTHVMREAYLQDNVIVQINGYVFVPSPLAGRLGPSDDVVSFGELSFKAWRLPASLSPLTPAPARVE